MSNFLAIATVTAALQRMLQGRVGADVPGAHVWTDRPDARQNAANGPGLNIYLYQVSPDPAQRNADLPTRAADGQLVRRPQAALTLHYLFSCYGDDNELEPQRVLGSAVRTLHARPVITRELIEAVTDAANDNPPIHPELVDADLGRQADLVRLAPLGLNLEELSKLWSVFFQVPYALSIAYQASVVLIEETVTPVAGRPVVTADLTVGPLNRPRITGVGKPDGSPVSAGDTITIRGERLLGTALAVRVGGQPATPDATAPDHLTIDLSTVGDLRPGGVPVQLSHGPLPEQSNVAHFVLHPAVDQVSAAGGSVTVTTDLTIGTRQQAALALFDPATGERVHAFAVPERTADTRALTVPVPGAGPGSYRVQLLVDGAESEPDGPVVTL
jgi:Pvc16 N-terminal domain